MRRQIWAYCADSSLYYGQFDEEWEKRDGVGIYYFTDGRADIERYKAGKSVGKGVRWSADRKTIMLLKDDKETGASLSADAAVELGKKIVGKLSLRLPPLTYEQVCADHAPPHHSRVLFSPVARS